MHGKTRFIARKNLVLIKHSGETGFTYEDFVFNDLLGPTDTSLPIEKAIKTDFNVIITWAISAGWIVLPLRNGEANFFNYIPLADFLQFETACKIIPSTEQPTSRELLLEEYIQSLKEDLDLLKRYAAGKTDVCLDQLIYLAKEYRTLGIQSSDSLIKALQSEIERFTNIKNEWKFDSSKLAI